MGHTPAGHGVDILMKWVRSPFAWFLLAIVVIAGLVAVGPREASLGENVRIVYLHAAWALTSEACFALAGLSGLGGILLRREKLHAWSATLGQTGIVFWIIYLPLSLWAMQSNWNGLFLAEPRFRLALTFAIAGVLLHVGLWIIRLPWLTSLANILFIVVLRAVFAAASNVMHPPPSPIFNSGNYVIMGFFIILNLLTWLAAYFLTRWFLQLKTEN
jgi:hypothetical protein